MKKARKLIVVLMAAVMMVTFMPFNIDNAWAGEVTGKTLASNIAKSYVQQTQITQDNNCLWVAADMAAYAKTVKGTTLTLSAMQKQEIANKAVELFETSTAPGDYAKSIIALTAIGKDARKLKDLGGNAINGVKLLTDLVNAEEMNSAVTSPYTIGYEIIALQQFGTTYQTEIDKLVSNAIENKIGWLDTTYGVDAIPPVMLALAPYYTTNNDVKSAIDEAKTALLDSTTLNDDGQVLGWGEAKSPETTALVIMGLKSVSENPSTFFAGKNLVTGLAKLQNGKGNGFPSDYDATMATEQGFRGLIASMNKAGYRLYDFSANKLSSFALSAAYDKSAKTDVKAVKVKTTTTKVSKSKVKVSASLGTWSTAAVKQMKKLGYTVKYKYYRSLKKTSGYVLKATKKASTYTMTKGTKNKRYYYKVKVAVYTDKGELISSSPLANSTYSTRIWGK